MVCGIDRKKGIEERLSSSGVVTYPNSNTILQILVYFGEEQVQQIQVMSILLDPGASRGLS